MFGTAPLSCLHPFQPHTLLYTPPPERYSSCLLCGQRFLRKNPQLLALHLQQQHPRQWEDTVESFLGKEGVGNHYLTPKTQPAYSVCYSPPHIYESVDTPKQVMNTLYNIYDTDEAFQAKVDNHDDLKSLVSVNLLYERINVKNCDTQNSDRNKYSNTPQRTEKSKCFRRPHPLPLSGLETYHGLPQPEPPLTPITGFPSEDSVSLSSDSEDYYHYTYASNKAFFGCNLCGDKFLDNPQLLKHLKSHHMAVTRALKAQYSCGKCPAKFFKNAFLLKHIETHCKR